MTAEASTSVVELKQDGDVLLVSVNNPPVNALGAAVRQGLMAAMEQADASASVKAVVIVGQGRAFIAGADIREFGKPPVPPPARCLQPYRGLQQARGGRDSWRGPGWRSGDRHVGALPSGTAWREAGSARSLPGPGARRRWHPACTAPDGREGRDRAHAQRPADRHQSRTGSGSGGQAGRGLGPVAAGLAYARELLAQGAPLRPVSATPGRLADKAAAQAELDVLRADTAKSRGLFSPLKIIDCVQAALDLPFAEGLKFERAQFLACIDSPQRAGLIHAFFAERETAKIPEARAAQPRAFSKIAIIGGGTMGAGITVSALDAGLVVTMIERDAESIARGQANVEKVYNGLIAKGRMSEEAKAAIMARYTPSTRYDDIADVDLVIEAVFEDLEVKKAVFRSWTASARAAPCWPPTPRIWISTRLPPSPAARRT